MEAASFKLRNSHLVDAQQESSSSLLESADDVLEGGKMHLKILVVSWNIGNAQPPLKLDGLFPEELHEYDLVVIGLQESFYRIEVGIENLTDCYSDFSLKCSQHLGKRFFRVQQVKREQMQMLVFASRRIKSSINKVERNAENTGLLHMFPNKGGVCTTLRIGSTSLALVSCHLTAHEGRHRDRNSSLEEIFGGVFKGDAMSKFHHIIVLGDLNYRTYFDAVESRSMVSRPMNRREREAYVMDVIERECWEELLEMDELTREMAEGSALCGFTALAPTFPPSFKRRRARAVILNSPSVATDIDADAGAVSGEDNDGEDSAEEEEPETAAPRHAIYQDVFDLKRLPSYCDRIAHASLPGFSSADHFAALSFELCESVSTSDHKPVRSSFSMRVLGAQDRIPFFNKAATADQGKHAYVLVEAMDLRARGLGGGQGEYVVRASTDPADLPLFSNACALQTSAARGGSAAWLSDLISFKLQTTDVDALAEYAHLFLSVWDLRRDAHVGTIAIAFKDIVEKSMLGEALEFDGFVHDKAIRQGELGGKISVELVSGDMSKPRKSSGVCCAVN